MATQTELAPIEGTLSVANPKPGVYDVVLAEPVGNAPEPEFSSMATANGTSNDAEKDRYPFEKTIVFLTVKGYVEKSSKKIVLDCYVLGMRVGSGYEAGLRDGLAVSFEAKLFWYSLRVRYETGGLIFGADLKLRNLFTGSESRHNDEWKVPLPF